MHNELFRVSNHRIVLPSIVSRDGFLSGNIITVQQLLFIETRVKLPLCSCATKYCLRTVLKTASYILQM